MWRVTATNCWLELQTTQWHEAPFHLRLCILNASKCNLSSCLVRRAIFVIPRASLNLIMWLTKLKRSRIYGDEKRRKPSNISHAVKISWILFCLPSRFLVDSFIFTAFVLTLASNDRKCFIRQNYIHPTKRQYIFKSDK